MGLMGRFRDFLGRVVSAEVSEGGRDAAGAGEAAASVAWMEAARAAIASYVVSAIQLCDIRFYGPGGEPEMGDAAWLWNVSPNPNQSSAELRAALLGDLLTGDGRAVVVPVTSGSRKRIYVADGGTLPERVPGAPAVYRNLSVEGSTAAVGRPMTSDEVYSFDASGLGGGWCDLMARMGEVYDSLADLMVQSERDRSGKWVLRLDQQVTGTPEQKREFERQAVASAASFARSQGGVMPLYRGQDLAKVSSSSSGSAAQQFADGVSAMRRDMFATVAACFRMPASLLEGNVNNFDATLSSFLTFAVDPVARLLSEEITRKTYTPEEWANGARARVDTTRIRHVDIFQIADAAAKLVGSTIDSPNEIRGFTGQDPIPEPWADEYQRTKNNEAAGGGEYE